MIDPNQENERPALDDEDAAYQQFLRDNEDLPTPEPEAPRLGPYQSYRTLRAAPANGEGTPVPRPEGAADAARSAPRPANRADPAEHFEPFNRDRVSRLTQAAGEGLDLGLQFYNADDAGNYQRSKDNLLFRGITVIAARTGHGKTTLLNALAARALAIDPEARVLFISLEESEADISRKVLSAYLYETCDANAAPIFLSAITEDARGRGIQWAFKERIDAAYSALADRLTIIDPEAYEEARDKWIAERAAVAAPQEIPPAQESELAAAATWQADDCTTVKDLIRRYRDLYGDKALFFIDYVQCLHNRDETGGDSAYKEFKAVMKDLISCARDGAAIFLSAQMNREGVKPLRATPEDHATVFWSGGVHHLREADDIGHAANMILYSQIDRDYKKDYLNLRVLKYRGGKPLQCAAVPLNFDVFAPDFAMLDIPSFPSEDREAEKKEAEKRRARKSKSGKPAREEEEDDEDIPFHLMTKKKD